ncbi:MAG: acetyl-CoA hydrolase/transferase C-terminal domain-containing protein [Rhodospirillales bacterium]
MTQFHSEVEACVDAILARVGKKLVLGLPLGLGKANHIANAIYARAAADPSITLKIFAALTLEKRQSGPDLLQRFVNPIVDRLFGDYPELAYATAQRRDALPANITVNEFYVMPGRWLGNGPVQRNYISVNYASAPRLLLDLGVNVIAQLVARRGEGASDELSLSCNPDITRELLPEIERRRGSDRQIVLAGQVNRELPFMVGDAAVPTTTFDYLLDAPQYQFALFAPPQEAATLARYATALHISRLVGDGGSLQIGIGALGDAVAWALILRHRQNAQYRELMRQLTGRDAEAAAFEQGLYGITEMFVDAFLQLYRAGVLKRRAADGALLHGAFFLGPKSFYRTLREMPEDERGQFHMTRISFTNEIGGDDEPRKRADRIKGRFINSGMMATLLGEVISDTREDGQVVSGVGGQYNFVAQAQALADGRSILAVNAVRSSKGKTFSNIKWSYGISTIPRHLRDMIATEYGVADLRGKTDRDCIAAMLAIADSRFQDELLRQAKANGKIEADYRIADTFRQNLPERLAEKLRPARQAGLLPDYPFGSDLDATEQVTVRGLERLQVLSASRIKTIVALFHSLAIGKVGDDDVRALARLGLQNPTSLKDRITARLFRYALAQPNEWGE